LINCASTFFKLRLHEPARPEGHQILAKKPEGRCLAKFCYAKLVI
jgi:hypothetical protein